MIRIRKHGPPTVRVPAVIARHYAWLEELGFTAVEGSESWGPSATYASEHVLVRPSYEEREEFVDVSVARRRSPDLSDEPFWARVSVRELLDRRAPDGTDWSARSSRIRGKGEVEAALAYGADLLRTHGADLLEGRNLDLLDEIVEQRPHHGVPGLDFPTSEPWAMSAEGVLFFTDSELPRPMDVYLERSRSSDGETRAVAALKIVVATRLTRDPTMLALGHERLHELLADPEPDVYRAAASALGEWQDADALDEILVLLEKERGDEMSPVAASATFIAIGRPKRDKARVLDALHRFASLHTVAAHQVGQLAWRLGEGHGRGYGRVTRMWHGPDV